MNEKKELIPRTGKEFDDKLMQIMEQFIERSMVGLDDCEMSGDAINMLKLAYMVGVMQGLTWGAGVDDEIVGPDEFLLKIEALRLERLGGGQE